MKNFIFALLAALSSLVASAQTPIPYFQDFENLPNGLTPNEMDIIDLDTCIEVGPLPPMDVWTIAQKSSQGDSMIFVRSTYTDTNCISNDWLIIGPFTGVTNLTKWKWECCAYYADESYAVYASTGNLPADFIQAGSIDSFTKSEAFQIIYLDSVSLSAYAGQDIYVAYRYVSKNKENIFIDNISIANDTTISVVENIVNELLIYPNPNNGIFTVQTREPTFITVLNMLGQVVHQEYTNQQQTNIYLNKLDSGLYTVKLANKKGVVSQKIIKQ